MIERAPMRPSRSFLALCALCCLVAVAGCNFDPLSAPVPTYTCTSARSCPNGACIDGVCASSTASGYRLVLRTIVPATSNLGGVRTFTHPQYAFAASEMRDLSFPPSHAVYGVVRFEGGDVKLNAQVTFTRVLAIAGRFVDEVRTVTPGPAVSDDLDPAADYRVDVAASDAHLAVVMPSPALTPALAGVPGNLVGQPLSEVFPPMVVLVDPLNVTTSSTRVDFRYPSSLFTPCAGTTAVACTATGRVVTLDSAGQSVPKQGLRVYLENVDTEQPISTTATTDANGYFAIRVSDTFATSRLRVSGSDSEPAFPLVSLSDGAFDPHVGGEVVVPSVNVVHFVGRVEHGGEPVPYAVVRAVARELTAADGTKIPGAEYESTVRTTTAAAADGAGFFTFDLVEGQYAFIASDSSTDSSVALSAVVVAQPPGGGEQTGQTFILGPALHVGGAIAGPDERALPYSTIEAIPYVPWNATGTVEASARATSTTSDAASHFDLMVDSGYFDVVVSNDLAEGLPVAVLPHLAFMRGGSNDWLMVRVPRAAVLTGVVRGADGTPIPDARVEAYVIVRETLPADSPDRPIALGQAVADGSGAYRLLLPSSIGN